MNADWEANLHHEQLATHHRAAVFGLICAASGHFLFIGLFWHLGVGTMCLVNVASVALYAYCLAALPRARRDNKYGTIGALAVGELLVHAILATHYVGLEAGFQDYAYALISSPFYAFRRSLPVLYGRIAFVVVTLLTLELVMSLTPPVIELTTEQLTRLRMFNLFIFMNVLGAVCVLSGRGQVKVEQELQRVATTDFLTGLVNRRHMQELLERAISHTRRSASPMSILLLDIDFFKRINDEHGHDVGDETLRRVARAIKDVIRPLDECARWGGEEFLVLLREGERDDAERAAERVLDSIRAVRVPAADGEISVTATCGLVSADKTALDLEPLLKCVDQALYAGKANGRNQLVIA